MSRSPETFMDRSVRINDAIEAFAEQSATWAEECLHDLVDTDQFKLNLTADEKRACHQWIKICIEGDYS